MDCLKCKKEMVIKNQDTSHDFKNQKEYSRTVCWCEEDDIWVRVEAPKEI